MERECKHPTCGTTCRRPKKAVKVYQLKRAAIRQVKQKPIPKESKARAAINRLYAIKSKLYREKNPVCKIKSPVCTKHTEGVHHTKGKATIQLLMDEAYWMPACNRCNGYVEDHSAWAFENGFKVSKFG